MSGFYDRSERTIDDWGARLLYKLLLPALIWCVLGNLYLSLLSFLKDGYVEYKFDVFSPCSGNGPAWFLLSLFYTKILLWFIIRLNNRVLISIICLVLGYIGSRYQMPMNFDEGLAALPLYYSGKIVYPRLKDIIHNHIIFCVGIIASFLFLFTPYYYNIGPSNPLYNPYYIFSICGIFGVFFIVLRVAEFLQGSLVLLNLGTKTFGIMLVHAPLCHTVAVIMNRLFIKGSIIWIISFLIAYLFIIVASYGFTLYIDKRIPILFGNKR